MPLFSDIYWLKLFFLESADIFSTSTRESFEGILDILGTPPGTYDPVYLVVRCFGMKQEWGVPVMAPPPPMAWPVAGGPRRGGLALAGASVMAET